MSEQISPFKVTSLQGEIALCQGREHFLQILQIQGNLAFKILRPSNKYPSLAAGSQYFPRKALILAYDTYQAVCSDFFLTLFLILNPEPNFQQFVPLRGMEGS